MITRADTVVIALAALLLPALYVNLWGDGTRAESATILMDDEQRLTVPLNIDQKYTIDGPLGPSIIEVKDGRIRFVSSPCRGKQCIHSGWLSDGGEFAACLPNHISIALSGPVSRFDTINF